MLLAITTSCVTVYWVRYHLLSSLLNLLLSNLIGFLFSKLKSSKHLSLASQGRYFSPLIGLAALLHPLVRWATGTVHRYFKCGFVTNLYRRIRMLTFLYLIPFLIIPNRKFAFFHYYSTQSWMLLFSAHRWGKHSGPIKHQIMSLKKLWSLDFWIHLGTMSSFKKKKLYWPNPFSTKVVKCQLSQGVIKMNDYRAFCTLKGKCRNNNRWAKHIFQHYDPITLAFPLQ